MQPNWLIFVEGVSCPSGGVNNVWDNDTSNDEDCGWWGGNLSAGRRSTRSRCQVANRLVYSPHEYATSVYHQTWFDDPTYPANMPAHLGQLLGLPVQAEHRPDHGRRVRHARCRADIDKVWLQNLMAYMGTGVNGMSFTYWSWNPDSGDTGGIVKDDWTTVEPGQAGDPPAVPDPAGAGRRQDELAGPPAARHRLPAP